MNVRQTPLPGVVAVDIDPTLEEGILKQILGLLRVVNESEQDTQQGGGVALVEYGAGPGLARLKASDQLCLIGRDR